MTDSTNTEQVDATADTSADSTVPAKETDWKAEARKWEARAKANKDAQGALAAYEEAQKTEAEKAAERLAQLEAENLAFKQAEQVRKWTAEVAETAGVPAALLRGSSLEELQAHAETLKPFVTKPETEEPQQQASFPAGTTPKSASGVPLEQQIALAEQEGNYQLAGQLKATMLGKKLGN